MGATLALPCRIRPPEHAAGVGNRCRLRGASGVGQPDFLLRHHPRTAHRSLRTDADLNAVLRAVFWGGGTSASRPRAAPRCCARSPASESSSPSFCPEPPARATRVTARPGLSRRGLRPPETKGRRSALSDQLCCDARPGRLATRRGPRTGLCSAQNMYTTEAREEQDGQHHHWVDVQCVLLSLVIP